MQLAWQARSGVTPLSVRKDEIQRYLEIILILIERIDRLTV
jgi:hypothetical protein